MSSPAVTQQRVRASYSEGRRRRTEAVALVEHEPQPVDAHERPRRLPVLVREALERDENHIPPALGHEPQPPFSCQSPLPSAVGRVLALDPLMQLTAALRP